MKLTIALLAALISLPAYAIDKCVPGQKRSATETCVVDGDTIWLDGVKIRLEGFDTPEPQTAICGGRAEIELAHRASDRLVDLLNETVWEIEYHGLDSTQEKRRLATISIDGQDVGDILINEGLARKWPDGKEWWCE
jgi:endonuclease YncB( thermonuclease family)